MNSLSDVFSFEELSEFLTKLENEYGTLDYSVESKIDGLSVALHYENGDLIYGATRGDGFVGENALTAPQANAMAAVIQPLMTGGSTPWILYFMGTPIAVKTKAKAAPIK